MDNITYNQFNVYNDQVGDTKFYLKGGATIDLLFDGDEILDIRLPSHVILDVTETEPGVKGNTATGATNQLHWKLVLPYKCHYLLMKRTQTLLYIHNVYVMVTCLHYVKKITYIIMSHEICQVHFMP